MGESDPTSEMERLLAEAEELAGIGSWGMDLETMQGVWSDGMYRIHGLEPGSAEPSLEMLVSHTHPEDRERLRSLIASILDDPGAVPPEGVTAEYRALRADGSVREVRFHGHTAPAAAGRAARWTGVAQDITEQRLTERELQARYGVTHALRDWESFDEGVVSLLRRFGTALDYPLGVLWAWDDKEQRLVARATWSAPGIEAEPFEEGTRGMSFRSGQGVVGKVWQTGQPVFVEELSEQIEASRRDLAREVGLRSALAFPALGEDGPLALLTFYALDRRDPSERLLLTLSSIGRELGQFLAGRRAELGSRRLSDRELEVLRLAAEGFSGPEIAERLFVSPATVKTHFEHVYEKLGVGDRAAAVAHALRTGLIR